MKKLTMAWKKGEKEFHSIYGVKNDFALELLIMKAIPISMKDASKLGLKNTSSDQIVTFITAKEASKYLESKGWKWVNIIKGRQMSKKTDDFKEWGDAWVYCNQHLRVHKTGWCTVSVNNKVCVCSGEKTEDEAEKKCKKWGFKIV
ncbi:MAG: hypothetical protein WC119_00425 [Synergistaceae bacterium]